MRKRLVAVHVQDTGRDTRPIEQVADQCDHALDDVALDHLLADRTFAPAVEQDALRHHHGATPLAGTHGPDHVLQPGKVRVGIRRAAPDIPAIRVSFKALSAPSVEAKRRIGQHAVKLLQLSVVDEHRLAQCIFTANFEFLCAMQEQIHAGNGTGGEVLLLTINLAVGLLGIIHVSNGLDEHPPGAACRIIDRFAGFRLQQLDHEFHDAARRIEFTGILLAHVSEFLDQILIGIAHDIGRIVLVAHRQ